MGEGHGIGLVAHAQPLQAVLPGVFERIANDALNSFAGVDVFLNGNLVGSALLEDATDADIQAFGVLPKDDQANVFFSAVAQRRQPVMEQLNGPRIHIEVQLEAQTQQDVGSMLVQRNTWIAQRAEKDGVIFIPQQLDGARRQRYALTQILIGAPVKLDKFERAIAGGTNRLQDPHCLWSDFRPDAIARDDGNARL